jgi:aminopeptidase N
MRIFVAKGPASVCRPRLGLPLVGLLLAAALVAASAQGASPPLDLDVELDPGTRQFRAVAHVRPDRRAHPRGFDFALHESLNVLSASADGKPVRIVAVRRQGALRQWRAAAPTGTTLRLEYGGTLPALTAELDHRDVLRQLPPMSASAGSFLPAGSGWYPQPAARFAYRVTISVPAGQRAIVPGRLDTETQVAGDTGRYRASFEFSQPADGIDLMAGPWLIRERIVARASGAPLRLRTYFTPELDATQGLAEGYLADSARYLERYAQEIGAYPYTEFSIVASPLPTGFGMPTLTYLGADVLRLPFIRATSLGHEVLHNWWGNGVFVDYTRGNWSEGLTTFMADYAYKEQDSAAAAREMRLGWLRDFSASKAARQPNLAAFRSRTHGAEAAVGYGKAAMLFVMLRDAIGDDAFERGIRLFWQAQRFRSADWHALRAAFEQASSRSLETFFAQWLSRPGAPHPRITRAIAHGNRATRLTLELAQAAPAYALHLPVHLVFPDRTETRSVAIDATRATVTLNLESAPIGVRLDPDLRVWRVLDPEQLPPILRQWIVAPAPRLVLVSDSADMRRAATELSARLFETPPSAIVHAEQIGDGEAPALLVGLPTDIDAALARIGAPPRPREVIAQGSAQVWTVQRESGPPLAVISADSAAALRALLRPLPHYGAQSWLVFDGSRALARGAWAAPGRLIAVEQDAESSTGANR